MRKLFYFVIALAILAGALWMFGPRVPVDTTVTFDPNSIGDDVDAYLAAENAATPNLREGLGKEVIWAYPASKARTPLAIVYVHGFSASKGEIRPLPDMVAASLGANLFFTRLTGHAQDSAAMGAATVNDWINDYAEAIAIGRRIGDRVIVHSGTSNGGSPR